MAADGQCCFQAIDQGVGSRHNPSGLVSVQAVNSLFCSRMPQSTQPLEFLFERTDVAFVEFYLIAMGLQSLFDAPLVDDGTG